MKIYTINEKEYYKLDDLRNAGHRGLKECDNDYQEFIRRNCLVRDQDYVAAKIGRCWNATYEDDKDGDLYITKGWINKTKEICPWGLPNRYLHSQEKICDNNGIVYEIDIRGEGKLSDCYFSVDDINDRLSRYRKISLETEIAAYQSEYIEDIHYRYFKFLKANDMYMYLTYEGLEKLFNSWVPNEFSEWLARSATSIPEPISTPDAIDNLKELVSITFDLKIKELELEKKDLELRIKDMYLQRAESELKSLRG